MNTRIIILTLCLGISLCPIKEQALDLQDKIKAAVAAAATAAKPLKEALTSNYALGVYSSIAVWTGLHITKSLTKPYLAKVSGTQEQAEHQMQLLSLEKEKLEIQQLKTAFETHNAEELQKTFDHYKKLLEEKIARINSNQNLSEEEKTRYIALLQMRKEHTEDTLNDAIIMYSEKRIHAAADPNIKAAFKNARHHPNYAPSYPVS